MIEASEGPVVAPLLQPQVSGPLLTHKVLRLHRHEVSKPVYKYLDDLLTAFRETVAEPVLQSTSFPIALKRLQKTRPFFESFVFAMVGAQVLAARDALVKEARPIEGRSLFLKVSKAHPLLEEPWALVRPEARRMLSGRDELLFEHLFRSMASTANLGIQFAKRFDDPSEREPEKVAAMVGPELARLHEVRVASEALGLICLMALQGECEVRSQKVFSRLLELAYDQWLEHYQALATWIEHLKSLGLVRKQEERPDVAPSGPMDQAEVEFWSGASAEPDLHG